MNKHTPGPWSASKNEYQGLVISEETGANVAVTYAVEDADLVAAAPDMYETLCRIEAALLCDDSKNYESLPAMKEDVMLALNKAKGL